ncbi:Uncharacterised protein [Vibrio cholerae]|nr:Uncharacterised protein [Vibrio cholerae]
MPKEVPSSGKSSNPMRGRQTGDFVHNWLVC